MPPESLLTVPDDIRLTVEIENASPVLLDDFTASFGGLGDEYELYARERGWATPVPGVRLYVREIRAGSIIADLIALAPFALPFVEHANTIIEFTKHLGEIYSRLLGRKAQPAAAVNLTKRDYENVSSIVEPVAKDSASQINFTATINSHVEYHFHMDSIEANAAQNAARREIAQLQQPATGMHDKVAMYFYQARNDPKATAGDRAIIESISDNPVKVVFANEDLKSMALRSVENPFTHAYVADVAVETIGGKPALYRVERIHEVIDKP
jgi:hypothetical protein